MEPGTYTLAEIRRVAGDLNRATETVAEEWARAVLHAISPMDWSYVTYEALPVSRRVRLKRRIKQWKWRAAGYRDRIETAMDVLRGRHDCDY